MTLIMKLNQNSTQMMIRSPLYLLDHTHDIAGPLLNEKPTPYV